MIFQIGPDQFMREMELLIWSVANALTGMISFVMISESFDKKFDNSQRKAMVLFGYYFLLMTLSNVFNYVWRLYILIYQGIFLAEIMELISLSFISSAGWILIVYYYDLNYERFTWWSLHFISIGIAIISLIWSLIMGNIILSIPFYIAIGISLVFFPIQFGLISHNSVGFFRRNTLRISLGGLIYFIAVTIQKRNMELLLPTFIIPDILLFISPFMVCVSMTMLFIGLYEIYCLDLERNKRKRDVS